jgi:hypothetical protein
MPTSADLLTRRESTMRKALLVTVIAALGLACLALPALAVEAARLKETRGDAPGGAPVPCVATANINGTCGNYRWYNFCSGYIWIYSAWVAGDEVGEEFNSADAMPCVAPGNVVKRTITYFRNTIPNYNQLVDVILNADAGAGDGCPDAVIAQDLGLDPALRWNCSNFGAAIPAGVTALVVSQRHYGGTGPTFATDGAVEALCPEPAPHSFYYGVGRTQCLAIVGPLGTYDNWPIWLVIDGGTATENTSWGKIKGLYQ